MRGASVPRAATAVLALAGGAVVGVSAVGLHGYWWGPLLGIAATAALTVAIPGGWWRRLPFAIGWFAAALVLAVERPEGDYLVEATASGYLLLGAGVGVLLGGVVGLRQRAAPEAAINGPDVSTS